MVNQWAAVEGGAHYDESGWQSVFIEVTLDSVVHSRSIFVSPSSRLHPELFSAAMDMLTSLMEQQIERYQKIEEYERNEETLG